VYCDGLQELIESTTGLFVSPFRKAWRLHSIVL
jgi:hypothetical protein